MKPLSFSLSILLAIFAVPTFSVAEDIVEFVSGAKLSGEVTEIDKTGKMVTFQSTIGNTTNERQYRYDQIHAITYRGRRFVLNPIVSNAPGTPKPVSRTRQELLQHIQSVGSTDPPWLNETPLKYPSTLDLTWPDPPKQHWDNQKFVGQYVWDVINPNESRWREGVKLLHHVVEVNQDNPAIRVKAMNQLGTLYASLLEDWVRAAYWWREAGKGTQGAMGVGGFRSGYDTGLARCYLKLGNSDMAKQVLGKNGGTPVIWCELGDHDRALKIAEEYRKGWRKEQALLICGDVCRHAGWYDKALGYYQQASKLPADDKYKSTIPNAKERIIALQAEKGLDLASIRDGLHRASSIGYSGDLHVAVQVKSHKIESVKVTKHVEKQYYSSIEDMPRQIKEAQGVQGVDATSGATITANAIIRATAKALAN